MKKSLFWSVSNPENGVESFILGTMHKCSPEVFEKISFIDTYLDIVSGVAFEIDLTDKTDHIADLGFLPENKVLADFTDQKVYSKLRSKIRKYYQLDLDSVSRMRPIFINALLQERQLGSNTVLMDESIYKKSAELGVKIVGLENQEDNFKIFDTLKIEDEINQLLKAIGNISDSNSKLKSLEKAYFNEDIQKLYKMSKRGIGKYRGLLLYDRNRFFVKKLCELVKGESFLICIGAGHLGGKFGVLRGLKSCGYKVNPLKPKDR